MSIIVLIRSKNKIIFIYSILGNIFRSFQKYFNDNKEIISVPMHLYIADFDVIDEIALHFNIKETVLTEKEGKSIFFSVAKNERFLKSKDLYRIIPLRIDQMNSLELFPCVFL